MIAIDAWDGSESQLHAASDLYARVFVEPPYSDDPDASRTDFAERATRYARTKPNFRLLLAWAVSISRVSCSARG